MRVYETSGRAVAVDTFMRTNREALETPENEKRKGEGKVYVCEECGIMLYQKRDVCPYCGGNSEC